MKSAPTGFSSIAGTTIMSGRFPRTGMDAFFWCQEGGQEISVAGSRHFQPQKRGRFVVMAEIFQNGSSLVALSLKIRKRRFGLPMPIPTLRTMKLLNASMRPTSV
jgi:hypothetical protein